MKNSCGDIGVDYIQIQFNKPPHTGSYNISCTSCKVGELVTISLSNDWYDLVSDGIIRFKISVRLVDQSGNSFFVVNLVESRNLEFVMPNYLESQNLTLIISIIDYY